MAASSYKNDLQELLAKDPQKKGWRIEYHHTYLDTKEWVSECRVIDSRDNILKFHGHIESRKVDSDQSAAKKALDFFHGERKESSSQLLSKITKHTVVVIDIENVGTALREAKKYFGDITKGSIIDLIFFHSSNFHSPDIGDTIPEAFNFYVVPSTHRDAADVGMCFYLGYHFMSLVTNFPSMIPDYHIITKDHFASTLRECIVGYRRMFPSRGEYNVECYVHHSFEEFVESIRGE